jgi:RHS repeat-associated protein
MPTSMTASYFCASMVCFSPSRSAGKERDTESGNDYFEARYYGSSMGRWMSPDWSAKAEPVPYAKMDNPQSLNLYGYVDNNPLSRTDADGHDFWDKVVNLVHGNGFHDNPPPPGPKQQAMFGPNPGPQKPAPKPQGATFMVGFGAGVEAGGGKAGAAAAGNVNAALSVSDKGVQTGLVDNHVATANAGQTVADGTAQNGTPSIKGASGGVGLTFTVSTGTSLFDQVGSFQTTQFTIGVLQFGVSTGGGVTNYFGGLNTGVSSTTMTTDTTVGCVTGCSH